MSSFKSRNYVGLVVLAGWAACTAGCGSKPVETAQEKSVPVTAVKASTMEFRQVLQLQGSVESETVALVPAQVGGTVEALLVDEGDRVKAGQVLCRLEAEKLEQAVETRRQELAVAQSTLDVSRAQERQALVNEDKSKRDHLRYQQLRETEAVSIHQYEQAETHWKNMAAARQVAQAQVELAKARVKQAEAALAIAERDLSDAAVRAPMDGVISKKHHELGEMIESGNPVFTMDDPLALEVSCFAPGRYYPAVAVGTSRMDVWVNNKEIGTFPVTYCSPTVDTRLRTFEVKCRMKDLSRDVVPGLSADAAIVLERRSGRGVPAHCAINRAGQYVVFVVTNGRAHSVPVQIGFETDGYVEVNGLPEGEVTVVVRGQDMLNDGDAVNVVGDE